MPAWTMSSCGWNLAGFGAGIDEARELAARLTRARTALRVFTAGVAVKTSEKP